MKKPSTVLVCLWRHADAGEAFDDTEADWQRPLSARGRRQAERGAQWLRRHVGCNIELVSSPAVRARQTASALAVPRIDPRLSPNTDPLHVAQRYPGDIRRTIVLVGHQPWLGQLAAHWLAPSGLAPKGFTADSSTTAAIASHQDSAVSPDPLRMRKGSIWCFSVSESDNDGQRLEIVYQPKRSKLSP